MTSSRLEGEGAFQRWAAAGGWQRFLRWNSDGYFDRHGSVRPRIIAWGSKHKNKLENVRRLRPAAGQGGILLGFAFYAIAFHRHLDGSHQGF